jgi:hypothetical protein
MELTELTQARVIGALAFGAVALFWIAGRVSARRGQARFEALAQSFGRRPVRDGEFLSRFPVEVAGREIEVRYQYIGGGSGAGSWTPDWYLVTVVPLRGVSDLHSVDISPRSRRIPRGVEDAAEFEKHFSIRDTGYPLRDGWLDRQTRGAIQGFYSLDLPLSQLAIEEGKLIHRARSPLRAIGRDALLSLLTLQAEVAAALERAV